MIFTFWRSLEPVMVGIHFYLKQRYLRLKAITPFWDLTMKHKITTPLKRFSILHFVFLRTASVKVIRGLVQFLKGESLEPINILLRFTKSPPAVSKLTCYGLPCVPFISDLMCMFPPENIPASSRTIILHLKCLYFIKTLFFFNHTRGLLLGLAVSFCWSLEP